VAVVGDVVATVSPMADLRCDLLGAVLRRTSSDERRLPTGLTTL